MFRRCVLVLSVVLACSGRSNKPLRAWGTIEATDVAIASRVMGRVDQVTAREGDRVRRGELLVHLDLGPLLTQRDEAAAALEAARWREELLQAGTRREDIQAARDALQSAQARARQAREDFERNQALAQQGGLARQAAEQARTALRVAEAEAESRRSQLQKLLRGARAEELETAAAVRVQAEAALRTIEVQLKDAQLVSPIDGVLIHRIVEPGEVVLPGAPLLVVGELSRPYVDVYVPEPLTGRVKPGSPVEVYVDAFPERVFRGTVRSLASEAEFTPRNVQTADQRARLVYRTRIDVQDPDGVLLPGMPAFAEFKSAG